MPDDKIAQVIVQATPRPIWIAAGVVVTGIVTAVVFLIITRVIEIDWTTKKIDLTQRSIYGLPPEAVCAIALVASFIVTTAIVLLVMKLVDDEKNDALTPLRDSLIGTWQVTAKVPDGQPAWHGTANFAIEPEFKKLRLEMIIPESETYAELGINIYDIALNPRVDPVTLTYFAQLDFVKRTDKGAEAGNEIRMFFVRTKRIFVEGKERLEGTWHELTQSNVGSIVFERPLPVRHS